MLGGNKMGYILTVFLSYLLGSSNMAFYLSKLRRIDLKEHGSGNLGASNATILLGWRVGVAVGAHDILKAMVAVLVSQTVFPELPYIGAIAGGSCVLGHIFPFYLKFKGGKGFASYLGMTIALNWKIAIVVLLAVLVVTVLTDYIVAGTTMTIISVPLSLAIAERSVILMLILLVATAMMLVQHRENYARMRDGTEKGLRGAIRGDDRIR